MPYSESAKFVHERKINPKKFDPRSFKVKSTPDECVKITLACPRGHYHPLKKGKKKCDVTLEIQKIMLKKTCYPYRKGD